MDQCGKIRSSIHVWCWANPSLEGVLCWLWLPGSPQDGRPPAPWAEDHHLACFEGRVYHHQTTQELKGQASQQSFREIAKTHGGGLQNKGIALSVKSAYKPTQTGGNAVCAHGVYGLEPFQVFGGNHTVVKEQNVTSNSDPGRKED